MSTDHSTKPVIFLAFANDKNQFLPELAEEARRLRKRLREAKEVCDVFVWQNATADDILDEFQNPEYKGRIAIFHFGGHANSYSLLLESAEGKTVAAKGSGLAAFLAQQQGLDLVFLNACSTKAQVQDLLDAGVKAVIATDQKIPDSKAVGFAERFYAGLASGDELQKAFDAAKGASQMTGDDKQDAAEDANQRIGDTNKRDAVFAGGAPVDNGKDLTEAWELYLAPGEEDSIATWNLPDAANKPDFILPPLLRRKKLPPEPFPGLNYFREEHAEIFFGRSRQIRKLFQLITDDDLSADPIILLHGQTGVGKSSLLAAGLLPRLKQVAEVRYVRYEDADNDLAAALWRALGGDDLLNTSEIADSAPFFGESEGDLLTMWRDRETEEKPLVIILDQVEEVYTRTGKNPTQELADFVEALQTIFVDDVDRWPKGKLILSFRSEWLVEIRHWLSRKALPCNTEMSLDHLDKNGIIEAITGPCSSDRLKAYYKLEVEEKLPLIIADHLLADRGSAIAPTLQIILTIMWENVPGQPKKFNRNLYEKLQLEENNNKLDKWLDQQLANIAKTYPQASESGLILDLLAYHTNRLDRTRPRKWSELEQAYAAHVDILKCLISSCEDHALLVTLTGNNRVDKEPIIRLSHDTLAPSIRHKFDTSQKPGQRAYRRLRDLDSLSEADLKIVEEGKAGMRTWNDHEEQLVEAGRKTREADRKAQAKLRRWRRRRRFVFVLGLVALIGFAITVFIFWLQAKKAKAELIPWALTAQAQDIGEKQPLLALRLALEARSHLDRESCIEEFGEIPENPIDLLAKTDWMPESLDSCLNQLGQQIKQTQQEGEDPKEFVEGTIEKLAQNGYIAALAPDHNIKREYFSDDETNPVFVIDYEKKEDELRRSDILTWTQPLSGPVKSVKFPNYESNPLFVVHYDEVEGKTASSELRHVGNGKLIEKLSGPVEKIYFSDDETNPVFVIDYEGENGQLRRSDDLTWTQPLSSPVEKVHFSDYQINPIFVIDYEGENGQLRRSDDLAWTQPLSSSVERVHFSPHETNPVFVIDYEGENGQLRRSDDLTSTQWLSSPVMAVDFSPNEAIPRFVVRYTGNYSGELRHAGNGKLIEKLSNPVRGTYFSGNEVNSVFVVDYLLDKSPPELRRSDTGEDILKSSEHKLPDKKVKNVEFSSDETNSLFVVRYLDDTIALRRSNTGEPVELSGPVENVYFSDDETNPVFVIDYERKKGELRRSDDLTWTQPLSDQVSVVFPDKTGTFVGIGYDDDKTELWTTGDTPELLAQYESVSDLEIVLEQEETKRLFIKHENRSAYLVDLTWLENKLSDDELIEVACIPFDEEKRLFADEDPAFKRYLKEYDIAEPLSCPE